MQQFVPISLKHLFFDYTNEKYFYIVKIKKNVPQKEEIIGKVEKIKDFDQKYQKALIISTRMESRLEEMREVETQIGDILCEMASKEEQLVSLQTSLSESGKMFVELSKETHHLASSLSLLSLHFYSFKNIHLKDLQNSVTSYDDARLLYDDSLSNFTNLQEKKKKAIKIFAVSDEKMQQAEQEVQLKKKAHEMSCESINSKFILLNQKRCSFFFFLLSFLSHKNL